jgi:hypothetical protein
MLVRRGMHPRMGPRDLPFPQDLDGPHADRIAERPVPAGQEARDGEDGP